MSKPIPPRSGAIWIGVLGVLVALGACGSFSATTGAGRSGAASVTAAADSDGGARLSGAPPSGRAAPESAAALREAPAPERPGLGTRFGEDRQAPVREASFERQGDEPSFVASVHYNDRQGVEVLRARAERVWAYREDEPIFRTSRPGQPSRRFGGVVIRVVDEDGAALPTYHVGDRVLVVGEAGRRYAIVVENRTDRRFEVVAAVDGLDVTDGQTASFAKRGYIVAPHGRVEIEGYRRNLEQVAAFRFGSVRDSYAARSADFGARHVGVIGVALFAEAGADAPDLQEEAARREQADPFPGRFAQPPTR